MKAGVARGWLASVMAAGVMLAGVSLAEEMVLVGWTFPSADHGLVADQGIPVNTNQMISTHGAGAPTAIFTGATTQSARALGWDDGALIKYWMISFSTASFTNITLSSKQRSSSTGPKNFDVEYRVGEAGDWMSIPSAGIILADNWTSGVVNEVPLPLDVDDQEWVALRWIMKSNTSVSNDVVSSGGVSNIDDIYVRGRLMPQPALVAPVALAPASVRADRFTAQWAEVEGMLQGYELEVAKTAQFRQAGQAYLIDFEGAGETKTGYASGAVNLSGLNWNLTDVLIGTSTNDYKEDIRSARLRGYGTSSMTLLDVLPGGLSEISFSYRRYGTEAQVDWVVEYTVDDGETWEQIGEAFTAPASDDVQQFSGTPNVSEPVRVRIKHATETGTTERRLNIDNISLEPFWTEDEVINGYAPLFTTGTSALVEGFAPGKTYYYRVRAIGFGEGNIGPYSNVMRVNTVPGMVLIIQ